MKNEKKRARLSLILSMFIFGTIGIFRKYLPVPSAALAASRGLIGTLFLLLFCFIGRHKMSLADIKKNLPWLFFSGAFLGLNWVLLFEAYRYTSVASATLCYYMAPILVILVSPLFFGEKLSLKKLACIAAALLGMCFVSGIFKSGFSGSLRGILFGLGAAVFYASVVLINKKLQNISAYDKTIVQLAVSFAVVLPYSLLTEDLSGTSFTLFSAAMLLFVGIVHTGLAYTLYFGSVKSLSAQTCALFSYIDPIVAIILSAVFLKEPFGIFEAIGAVLVLGSALASEFTE